MYFCQIQLKGVRKKYIVLETLGEISVQLILCCKYIHLDYFLRN